MKVLFLQDYLRMGGTERQTLFLAAHFQKSGHQAWLLTFRPGGPLASTAREGGYPWRSLQTHDTRISLFAPGLRQAVREIAPEIILCMGRTANCYAGWLQQTFPDCFVVGTLRTGKTLFPLHWWSLSQVKALVVNSSWWKRRLLEHGFRTDAIHVVRNSVLIERCQAHGPLRMQWRRQEGLDDDSVVFLNIASFRPGKRQADLLRLFSRFREKVRGVDWRLWFVGEGREFHRCQQLARNLGLTPQTRFFGFQKNPYAWYCAADVAVSASREDSLPNFLIEAQAVGLPVVAWDYRGVRETFLPGKSGFLIPLDDEESFLSALQNLATSADLRHSMEAPAIEHVRANFSPAPQADRLIRFLQRLLRRR